MEEIRVDTTHVGDEAVVVVGGELDFSTAPRLEAALVDLARRRVAVVQLDLSGVGFMDSAGLRAIVIGHRATSVQGGTLRVVEASLRVRRVLELAGAESLLARGVDSNGDGALDDQARRPG